MNDTKEHNIEMEDVRGLMYVVSLLFIKNFASKREQNQDRDSGINLRIGEVMKIADIIVLIILVHL